MQFAPSIELAFGIDRTSGFFVDLGDPMDSSAPATKASATADVYLGQGSTLTGKLFFLNLTASVAPLEDMDGDGTLGETLDESADGIDYNRDGTIGGNVTEEADTDGYITNGVGFRGTAAFELGTGRLNFTQLDGLDPSFTLTLDGDLDVDFTASLSGQQDLPSIQAGLNIGWQYSNTDGSLRTRRRLWPSENIRLDLGSFFRENIAPVIDLFDDIFAHCRPSGMWWRRRSLSIRISPSCLAVIRSPSST